MAPRDHEDRNTKSQRHQGARDAVPQASQDIRVAERGLMIAANEEPLVEV